MFLTYSYQVTSAKSDDGQGKKRRRHGTKNKKAAERMTGLSHHKEAQLKVLRRYFTIAWARVVAWGMENLEQINFTYPITDKEGNPVFKKDGTPRVGRTDAHYLANWLSSKVDLSDLPFASKYANAARTQAAETLLSQYNLRRLAKDDPRRLTGLDVGRVNTTVRTHGNEAERYQRALRVILHPRARSWMVDVAERVLSGADRSPSLPITFAGPGDFMIFRHRKSGRLFVAIPTFARDDPHNEPVR